MILTRPSAEEVVAASKEALKAEVNLKAEKVFSVPISDSYPTASEPDLKHREEDLRGKGTGIFLTASDRGTSEISRDKRRRDQTVVFRILRDGLNAEVLKAEAAKVKEADSPV